MIYETRELEQVHDAFDEVLSGHAKARLVFDAGLRAPASASEGRLSRMKRQGDAGKK